MTLVIVAPKMVELVLLWMCQKVALTCYCYPQRLGLVAAYCALGCTFKKILIYASRYAFVSCCVAVLILVTCLLWNMRMGLAWSSLLRPVPILSDGATWILIDNFLHGFLRLSINVFLSASHLTLNITYLSTYYLLSIVQNSLLSSFIRHRLTHVQRWKWDFSDISPSVSLTEPDAVDEIWGCWSYFDDIHIIVLNCFYVFIYTKGTSKRNK